jgi:hypothetical protein
MSPSAKTVGISVTSALIVAVITWAAREFAGQSAVVHLRSFAVAFIPVWVGVAVYLFIWSLLSIRRVTRGRDDEYTKWLQARERDFSAWAERLRQDTQAAYEIKFVRMADHVQLLLRSNTEAIDGFNVGLQSKWVEVQKAIQVMDQRLTKVANLTPGYRDDRD